MTVELDLDEMFHLAILASKNGDHEKAILYLKQGVEAEGSARFHYMLGAEYAELSMFDRAIEYIAKAVELNPEIKEASFQLGLLYAMKNDMDQAKAAWDRLDDLGAEHYLYLFKSAILLADTAEFAVAMEAMKKGLSLNTANPALNSDMTKLLTHWETVMNSEQPEQQTESESESDSNYFLSAYQDKH